MTTGLALKVCEACEWNPVRGGGMCPDCLREDVELEARYKAARAYEQARVQMGVVPYRSTGTLLRWVLRLPKNVVACALAAVVIGCAVGIVGIITR